MVSELLAGEGGVKRQLRLSDPRAGSSPPPAPALCSEAPPVEFH